VEDLAEVLLRCLVEVLADTHLLCDEGDGVEVRLRLEERIDDLRHVLQVEVVRREQIRLLEVGARRQDDVSQIGCGREDVVGDHAELQLLHGFDDTVAV
jgi:hypothetical protein